MKKKLLTILLATFMVLTLVPATIFAATWSGEGKGTQTEPWKIGVTGHEGDVTAWVSEDGETLTIDGKNDGVMMDFEFNDPASIPWYSKKESITSVVINTGVTTLGKAFMGSDHTALLPNVTSITLPNTITEIGESAFGNFDTLTSIVIPEGVTTIKDRAFQGCTKLESVTIPSTVITIGIGAFQMCTKLENVTISTPSNLTTIGENVFGSCNVLKTITIPSKVTFIGKTAFASSGLTEIVVKATTPPTLGDGALPSISRCQIRKIYIPGGTMDAYSKADGWKDYADFLLCDPNQSASIEVTAIKEAQFSYTMVIPSNVPTIYEKDVDRYIEVGSPFIENVEGAKDTTVIKYTAVGTDFVNTEDKTKTMTADYAMPSEWSLEPMYTVTVYEDNEYVKPYKVDTGVYGPLPIFVQILKDVWAKAPAGTYKSTLTFNFTTSEKTPG